ncbi:winged helix-turn-helix transcriptional regulator [Nakamurella flavida]|uniref:Winged helix-turn-helix transcriptional regulator n=1 Tax=Nakamurella flavida TaxID=363630 RepID=A0A939C476_9ACTN|nr:MarR family winged helix-turn-helix transcriptional regulator [Nakamurella flavida]MBM9478455.1 winged helix-turn-helix transcriptional regulator [Nakamurella flavida]MDP9777721.1 DNA-binding MarR family transcriptional regulator [Nakamurella flavida]
MRAAELHRLARTLREIALEATGNTGPDRVNAGELAVLEDVARHARSTVGDITTRTGLAQSLVSRIVRSMAAAGALTVEPDTDDRRKVRIALTPATRTAILSRAAGTTRDALTAATPGLDDDERAELDRHLTAAADLLRRGARTPGDGSPTPDSL